MPSKLHPHPDRNPGFWRKAGHNQCIISCTLSQFKFRPGNPAPKATHTASEKYDTLVTPAQSSYNTVVTENIYIVFSSPSIKTTSSHTPQTKLPPPVSIRWVSRGISLPISLWIMTGVVALTAAMKAKRRWPRKWYGPWTTVTPCWCCCCYPTTTNPQTSWNLCFSLLQLEVKHTSRRGTMH